MQHEYFTYKVSHMSVKLLSGGLILEEENVIRC